MNKKIPIGFTVAIVAICAAIAFFAGSTITTNKINKTLVDLNEKQAMYGKLYELDQAVRINIGSTAINETDLIEGICSGYIDGLNCENVIYLTAEEYAQGDYSDNTVDTTVKLSDGSVLIFKAENEEETTESTEASTEETTEDNSAQTAQPTTDGSTTPSETETTATEVTT